MLIIFSASLVVIALFRRLNLPPVLGYLFVGVLINPAALGWVSHSEDLPRIAELGVVFLLFTLGLEFSLPRMLALRSVVFGLGSLQVIACTLPLAALLYFVFDLLPAAALLIGGGLALSSTAIVSKELTSLGEVFSKHGQNAIGVLIFQDLVAVLLLTMLPALAGGGSDSSWYMALGVTLGKTAVLFAGLFLTSRWLLPRLFHEVASARSPELFVLLVLVLVLMTAALTHLLGLSPALGAFLAGMLLGESHYRHQIEADIRPFRDILLGLFFVSVGMLIDFHQFLSDGLLIAGLTLALMLTKGAVVALLVHLRGGDANSAWRTGLALAQGGEFCFALVTQAGQVRLLPAEVGGLLLAATFCSMALTPLLLRAAPKFARWLQRRDAKDTVLEVAAASEALDQHVVICGYGRVGQSIGRFLRREKIAYIALDDDPVRVQEAAAGESCVHYGDSRRADLLEAVGLVRARLLVVAVDNAQATLRIVELARELHTALPILVRTRDDSHLAALQKAGATEVVPEVLESSLMLASTALVLLGLPQAQVQAQIDEVRRNRYSLLHGYYPGAQSDLLSSPDQQKVLLHAVNLNENAYACGKQLDELQLEELGVEVQAVRRDGEEMVVSGAAQLHHGDAVILSGPLDAIESCEARLLAGLR
nr:monovalent cation:proton antiporter family protein [Pseudomonas insulae]